MDQARVSGRRCGWRVGRGTFDRKADDSQVAAYFVAVYTFNKYSGAKDEKVARWYISF
jgi:hypothetical protein